MPLKQLTWDQAPKEATHQHTNSLFYRVVNDVVQVWSTKNGWSKSRVAANSSALTPRPNKEEAPVKVPNLIEASSPEELAQKLADLGIPAEAVAEMVKEVTGTEVEFVGDDEPTDTCSCEDCLAEEQRLALGEAVGPKVAQMLKMVKMISKSDFEVDDIMQQLGFAHQGPVEKRPVIRNPEDITLEEIEDLGDALTPVLVGIAKEHKLDRDAYLAMSDLTTQVMKGMYSRGYGFQG